MTRLPLNPRLEALSRGVDTRIDIPTPGMVNQSLLNTMNTFANQQNMQNGQISNMFGNQNPNNNLFGKRN